MEDMEDNIFENNRQRVIEILKKNPDFCKSLGIENFDESKVGLKEDGCMDGAVYNGENGKVFFKLSSCTAEDNIFEYSDDILGDYVGFSILRKFGCNVPEVHICKYSDKDDKDNKEKKNKYLFASKEINLKKEKMHTITNFLLEKYTKEEIGIDTSDFLKLLCGLYILGAQDLNRDNFLIDENCKITCIDADFRKFYFGFNVEEDDNFRHYNSIQIPLNDGILSRAFGDQIKFDFIGNRTKVNRLLATIIYFNQLAEDFDGFNKKGKLVFHPKLSQLIINDKQLTDNNLIDILENFKSVKFKQKDLLQNAYGLNEEGKNFIENTLKEIKKFAKGKLQFLEIGNEVVSPEPVVNSVSCSNEVGKPNPYDSKQFPILV